MKETKIEPKRLRNLEAKFRAFLQDVSLKSDSGDRRKGPDGLLHLDFQILSDGSARLQEPNRHGYYHTSKSKLLCLQWGDEALTAAVQEAQKLCPNISEKTIQQTLRDLMVKIFNEQVVTKNADPYADPNEASASEENGELETIVELLDLSDLAQRLARTVEWLRSLARPQMVYVPLEGLKIGGDSLILGDVKFHSRSRHQESNLDRLLRDLEEQRGDTNIPYIRESLKDVQCFATVELEGDEEFVRNKAIQSVTQMLHVLDLCLSSTAHQPNWAQLRISGVIVNQYLPAEKFKTEGVGYRQARSKSRALELRTEEQLLEILGATYDPPFSFQHSWRDDWEEKKETLNRSFSRLTTCFQSNNDMSKRIQRTVTWYSKAVDADTKDEKFVNLSIALESLLIGDEGKGPYATTGSISQNLGDRVAYLLADDFEDRRQREKEAKRLYGFRSAIIHRGESITQNQLIEMDKLVKEVFLAFLKHDFTSWNKFQKWIAQQKFGKPS